MNMPTLFFMIFIAVLALILVTYINFLQCSTGIKKLLDLKASVRKKMYF